MKLSKYAGWITLITVIALLMSSLALSMPWYKMESTREYYLEDDVRLDTAEYELFLDYYTEYLSYDLPYSVEDYSSAWRGEELEEFMDFEEKLVYVWFAIGILYLVVVLLNMRITSLVMGAATVAVLLLAVVKFAAGIERVVRNTNILPSESWETEMMAWDTGLDLMVAATMVQAAAVLLRMHVINEQVADYNAAMSLTTEPPKGP